MERTDDSDRHPGMRMSPGGGREPFQDQEDMLQKNTVSLIQASKMTSCEYKEAQVDVDTSELDLAPVDATQQIQRASANSRLVPQPFSFNLSSSSLALPCGSPACATRATPPSSNFRRATPGLSDMSSPPARKRPRMDDPDVEESDSEAAIKRDEELWFEDGTVVLVAGNVEFCIYKGLLADRSPVFKDMFAFPQPHAPSAEPSERPRVRLPDSPEDIRELLRMLLPDKQSRLYSGRKPSFHALSACIRLGHKYQVDHIVDDAMAFIRKAYPKDFPSYLERTMFRQEHAIGVVNLAHLVGATDVLPVAFLDCCALVSKNLVWGFLRPDGTREMLGPHDLARCVEAKDHLMRETVRRLYRMTRFKPSPKCDGEECLAEEAFATPLDEHDWRGGVSTRVLAPWGLSVKDGQICDACVRAWEDQVLVYRQDVWNRLPRILGLVVDDWVKS